MTRTTTANEPTIQLLCNIFIYYIKIEKYIQKDLYLTIQVHDIISDRAIFHPRTDIAAFS